MDLPPELSLYGTYLEPGFFLDFPYCCVSGRLAWVDLASNKGPRRLAVATPAEQLSVVARHDRRPAVSRA